MNGPFLPLGPTYLVAETAVQILGSASAAGGSCTKYRIRNLSSTAEYFAFGTSSSVSEPTAPSAGTPQSNTIGMLASSVEYFTLPPNVYIIAGNTTGFEVTPGDGIGCGL